MQKMIAVFDGLKYSLSTQRHAIEIAKQNNMHLVGVFLEDFTYQSYKIHELAEAEGILEDNIKKLDDKDQDTRNKAVEKFNAACLEAGVNFNVHRDKNMAMQELLHESIFADLLLINASENFTKYITPIPTEFIQDMLSDVQCPVLITTTVYKPVEKVYFLYNGDPASVYAIKMFDYLLPMYRGLPAEVVTVKSRKASLHIPDNRLMKELMKRHFPNVEYTVLKGDPDEAINNYLLDQNSNALAVLGAYQRSTVSRWFKPSMADYLIKELRIPLFIAHK